MAQSDQPSYGRPDEVLSLFGPSDISTPVDTLPTAGSEEPRPEWNQTNADYPRTASLASLFEAQVERTPDAVAIVSGDRQLTFRELNERANQIACHLRDRGAGPGISIGLCLGRSVDLVVCLVAIVKSGSAYVPIDPLLPVDRVQHMFEDSALSILITELALLENIPSFAGTTILLEDDDWKQNPTVNLGVPVDATELAYVIYTSGSTGKPKGVQIQWQAVINLLWCLRDWMQLGEADRVLSIITISFDMAVTEIWLPLLFGARLIFGSREDAADGDTLRDLLEKHDITFLQATPVTWRLLFLSGWTGKSNLQAICSAEPLPRDLAAQLVPAVRRLWNMYGPTETTVWSTGYHVTDAAAPILIGRPVANTRCYILDEQLQQVPVGATGELYLAGDGLAIGYRNRPDLTAAAFLPDPFDGPASRMYKTGDLARYHPDGNIECLGRIDHQVKLRGYRIELGEIEATLRKIPGISDAVVTLREDQFFDKHLIAYLIPENGALPETAEIVRSLKLTLPAYMVPPFYQRLDKLPLSPNGKVDRKALPPAAALEPISTHDFEGPTDPAQRTMAQIWREVLGINRIGVNDDYFELGGDSLRAVRLILKVREAFPDSRPTLATFLRAPTIAQFTREATGEQAEWTPIVRIREGAGRTPFFCVHGAGGNWMSMRALAMALPSAQPFYCMQARGLDGQSVPFTTVEETAAFYLEHIRRVQPHGPYNLGGGCYGGFVAFEMACLLRAAGESVNVLALIDSENRAYSRLIPRWRVLFFEVRFIVRRTFHHFRRLEVMGRGGRRSYTAVRMRVAWNSLKEVGRTVLGIAGPSKSQIASLVKLNAETLDDGIEQTLSRVRRASIIAYTTFFPKPYEGHVLVFRAKQRPDDPYSDLALGWGPVAFGGVTTCEIDCDHNDIFHNPAVLAVAERLDQALVASETLTT